MRPSHKMMLIMWFMLVFSPILTGLDITLGSGNQAFPTPFDRLHDYHASEMLVPRAQIQMSNYRITKLAFHKLSGSDTVPIRSVKIYMKHTTDVNLVTGPIHMDGYSFVYEGAVPNDILEGWKEVNLTNSFSYNNRDNLKILIIQNFQANLWDVPLVPVYACSPNEGDLCYREAGANFEAPDTLTICNYHPNIRLTFNPINPTTNFSVFPSSINFPVTQLYTASPEQNIILYNTGTTNLTVQSVSLEGTDVPNFLMQDDHTYPYLMSGNSNIHFTLRFHSTAYGTYQALLHFVIDSGDNYYIPVQGECADLSVTEFPYHEGFNSSMFPPPGWINIHDQGSLQTGVWQFATFQEWPETLPPEGAGMARFLCQDTEHMNSAILITPLLLMRDPSYGVSFYMYRSYPNDYQEQEYLSIWIGPSPDIATADSIGVIHTSFNLAPEESSMGWHQYLFNLPHHGERAHYLFLKAQSFSRYPILIDDLIIQEREDVLLPPQLLVPVDGATQVTPKITFRWQANPFSVTPPLGYKLYYGTDILGTNVCNGLDVGDENTYNPEPDLTPGATYHWRVVPYSADGDLDQVSTGTFQVINIPANVWFTYPSDNATNVSTNTALEWEGAYGASFYEVFWGTNLFNLSHSTVVTTNSCQPGPLEYDTDYYWRVIPHNDAGTPANNEYHCFRTCSPPHYNESTAIHSTGPDIGGIRLNDLDYGVTSPITYNPLAHGTYMWNPTCSVNLMEGQVIQMTLTPIFSHEFTECWVKVYVDFDKNGYFDEFAECLASEAIKLPQPLQTLVHVPDYVGMYGPTRMRIVLFQGTDEAEVYSEGAYPYGETEDFPVTIQQFRYINVPYHAELPEPQHLTCNLQGNTYLDYLGWYANYGRPTGYYLSLGTDNPPTNMLYRKVLGNDGFFYIHSLLSYNTTYFWQVIPFNPIGEALDCPIWTFSTDPNHTLFPPFTADFEDLTPPNLPPMWVSAEGQWHSLDAEGMTGSTSLYIECNHNQIMNDPLITAGIQLRANHHYRFAVHYKVARGNYPVWLKIRCGMASAFNQMTTSLYENPEITNTTYATFSSIITPESTGLYYFAINPYCTCFTGRQAFFIDDLSWEIVNRLPESTSGISTPLSRISIYPNPFHDRLQIHSDKGFAKGNTMTIFNIRGQKVRTISITENGREAIDWDGKDDKGHPLATGVYYLTLQQGSERITRKTILMK